MVFIRRLIWEEWNIAHIARHEVFPEEIEQVCHSDPLVQRGNKRDRLVLVGPTCKGRMLKVVLESLGFGSFYPITAHAASRRERLLYSREKDSPERVEVE